MKVNPRPTSYQLMVGFQWGWQRVRGTWKWGLRMDGPVGEPLPTLLGAWHCFWTVLSTCSLRHCWVGTGQRLSFEGSGQESPL